MGACCCKLCRHYSKYRAGSSICTLTIPTSDHLSYIMLTFWSYKTGVPLVILHTKAEIVLRFSLPQGQALPSPWPTPYTTATATNCPYELL
jgi:hypothetical protein